MSCTVSSFAIHTRDPYSHPHKAHGVHTASPHKAHGVHTATLTRHTGCIQQGPQDTRGAYSHPHRSVQPSAQDAYIFFHVHFSATMQYELAAANSPRGSILLLRDLRHGWVAEQV